MKKMLMVAMLLSAPFILQSTADTDYDWEMVGVTTKEQRKKDIADIKKIMNILRFNNKIDSAHYQMVVFDLLEKIKYKYLDDVIAILKRDVPRFKNGKIDKEQFYAQIEAMHEYYL